MLEGKKIGVAVPAYNEEGLIGRVVRTMPSFVDRIYVVDDCSLDKTSEAARASVNEGEAPERLVVIRHETNKGVGAAIVTGYKAAVQDGMEVVAVMAGDAQMDPGELAKVVAPVARGEADYVKGNRLFTG